VSASDLLEVVVPRDQGQAVLDRSFGDQRVRQPDRALGRAGAAVG